MAKKNMFIGWTSEDSILLRSRWKRLPKTCSCCLVFMYLSFWDEGEKKTKSTADAALSTFILCVKIFVNISKELSLGKLYSLQFWSC